MPCLLEFLRHTTASSTLRRFFIVDLLKPTIFLYTVVIRSSMFCVRWGLGYQQGFGHMGIACMCACPSRLRIGGEWCIDGNVLPFDVVLESLTRRSDVLMRYFDEVCLFHTRLVLTSPIMSQALTWRPFLLVYYIPFIMSINRGCIVAPLLKLYRLTYVTSGDILECTIL